MLPPVGFNAPVGALRPKAAKLVARRGCAATSLRGEFWARRAQNQLRSFWRVLKLLKVLKVLGGLGGFWGFEGFEGFFACFAFFAFSAFSAFSVFLFFLLFLHELACS